MQINGVITTGPSQTSTQALTMFFNPPILTTPHILGNMCNLSHISLQCFLINGHISPLMSANDDCYCISI